MLKNISKKIITILLIIAGVAGGFLIKKNSDRKKKIRGMKRVINHKQITEINDLKIIEDKAKSNEKFVLYIGHSLCGDCHDFYTYALHKILENNSELHIYYVDFFSRKDLKGNWDKVIGPKNSPDSINAMPSAVIKDFSFYFTPTLVFINNGKAEYSWSSFGGGPDRDARYFRSTEDKKTIGYQNAIIDVQELINKWK